MNQITVRGDDEMFERVRRVAASHGKSMNEYVVLVLEASTNPDSAGSELEAIRERLANAGLASQPRRRPRHRPDAIAVREAGARAAVGMQLSSIVSADR
jgi:plasmid stability protein